MGFEGFGIGAVLEGFFVFLDGLLLDGFDAVLRFVVFLKPPLVGLLSLLFPLSLISYLVLFNLLEGHLPEFGVVLGDLGEGAIMAGSGGRVIGEGRIRPFVGTEA